MINLLPHSVKQERMYGRRNRSMLFYTFSLLFVAGITTGIMIVSLQVVGGNEKQIRSEINNYNTEIEKLEAGIKNVEKTATRLDTAKKLSDLSIKFSDLIPKIGAVLPEGVVLNALSLTGGVTDPLQLDVDIVDASLAPILAANLVESDLFEAADITSLTPKGAGDDEDSDSKYKFGASVTASFTGTAEAKKKEASKAAAAKAAADAEAEKQEAAQ